MKKLFALLLMLALLLSSAAMAERDFTGLWTLNTIEEGGVSADAFGLGVNGSLLLNEQGSCLLELLDSTLNGTWAETEDGIVLTFGDDFTLIFTTSAIGALTTEFGGKTLTFTLAVADENSKMLTGQTMEDFNGEWVFVNARYMSQVSDAETLDMNINLQIQDGKGHMEQIRNGSTEAFDAVCELMELEQVTVMYLIPIDPATDKPAGTTLFLMLLDNGKLVWWGYDDAGYSIFYNFENAANVQN